MSDDLDCFPWPANDKEAIEFLNLTLEFLVDPLPRKILHEWAELRFRCHRKALKRQAVGRVYGKLSSCATNQAAAEQVMELDPEEAYALVRVLQLLCTTERVNALVYGPFHTEDEWKSTWAIALAKKALKWAMDQKGIYETEEYLEFRE